MIDKAEIKHLLKQEIDGVCRATGQKPEHVIRSRKIRNKVKAKIPGFESNWMDSTIKYNEVQRELEKEFRLK